MYLVSAGRNLHVRMLCSRYVIRMYLVSAGRNLYVRTLCSARGRTSDDSYIYQLSLVVATATMYLCPEVLPLQRYWSLCYDCELDFGRWVNVRNQQQQHQQSPWILRHPRHGGSSLLKIIAGRRRKKNARKRYRQWVKSRAKQPYRGTGQQPRKRALREAENHTERTIKAML